MSNPQPARSVERLFPFVLRAGILLIGREKLRHSKGKLHFVLITEDMAESVRAEILVDFKHYPVVQHYAAADLEKFFKIKGAKAIGFAKSGLAQSIYAELKEYRINRPVISTKKPPAVEDAVPKSMGDSVAPPGFGVRRPSAAIGHPQHSKAAEDCRSPRR